VDNNKPLHKLFQFLYGPFFYVLDFFMRHYKANRERLAVLMSKKGVASFMQIAAIVLLIIWILTFVFASEESRNILTEEVKKSFSELKTFNNK
jgi:magnesium-transporting ATPase (P-type)